jgi:hypothetical protein
MTTTPDTPPDDDGIVKKLTPGNRTDRRYRAGRIQGARNLRTREAEELLKQFGHDAPHVALLKLGNDNKIELALRAQMLAWAAPFFRFEVCGDATAPLSRGRTGSREAD